MRLIILLATACLVVPVQAAERVFDFSDFTGEHTPTNFISLVAGRGKPGEWRVILDEVPPALAPLTSQAPATSRRAVLAQRARDLSSGHLPLLIYEGDVFHDFKFTTRFKLMGGAIEQAAGLVFHFQNASNFYVVQAAALAGSFYCTKVVNGEVKPPIGPVVKLGKNQWHVMAVECDGPRITCSLDGDPSIKLVDNVSASAGGKIGFCTQADAVTYFVDAKVVYSSREILAEKMVREALRSYSRLLSLKIFASRSPTLEPVVVASGNPKDVGQKCGQVEADVIRTGHSYVGKGRETVTVFLPLRDRNGEPMAAIAVEMKKNVGQTEDNALVRARPVHQQLQAQVEVLDDLLQ